MSNVSLSNITSGYNLSIINSNFTLLQNSINLDRLQVSGGGNVMQQDLDLNGHSLLNSATLYTQSLVINGLAVVPSNLGSFAPNSVGTLQIIDGAVTDAKIASGINTSKLIYQPGAPKVQQTLNQELAKKLTVENYGAIGDGVTNDWAAIMAMLTDVGYIRLQSKRYYIGTQSIPYRNNIVIIGDKMPKPKGDLSGFQLGSGTVLIGEIIDTRSDYLHLQDFGIEGTTFAPASSQTGNFFNANNNTIGVNAVARNVASLGPAGDGVFATHGLCVQGFDRFNADNIYVGKHYHGLVCKNQSQTINNVDADQLYWEAVFIKSDNNAQAGFTNGGQISQAIVTNVKHRALNTNTTAAGVWVMAATLPVVKVQVNNVQQTYGLAGVILHGSGVVSDPQICAQCEVSNILTDSSQYGIQILGHVIDWNLSSLTSINPATGCALTMGSLSVGWAVNNCNVVITTSAITGTHAFEFFGQGVWNNLSIDNNIYQMVIWGNQFTDLAAIRTGSFSGNAIINGEGPITLINGAVGVTGDLPRIKILPNSVVELRGWVDMSASVSKAFSNPLTTGLDWCFAVGAKDSGGTTYGTQAVRMNSFQLTVEPAIPTTTKLVNLSGIRFQY